MAHTVLGTRSTMLTVSDYLEYLRASPDFVNWPPDVFAVAVSLLQKSGAYTRVVSDSWPPTGPKTAAPGTPASLWASEIRKIGLTWRSVVLSAPPQDPPAEVVDWWRTVLDRGSLTLAAVRSDDGFCTALLQLCAAADEASEGVGIPPFRDEYENRAWLLLDERGTLCLAIDPTVVRVLPKCHTPNVGMTVRSLSHHLSLIPAGDVEPRWYVFGRPGKQASEASTGRTLNLLLVPMPRLVLPGDFRGVDGPLQNLNESRFGFFTCDLGNRIDLDQIATLFDRAGKIVSSIDGVVLPELSLNEAQYQELKKMVVDERKAFLIAGVGRSARDAQFGENFVRFDTPIDIPSTEGEDRAAVDPQHKHHRWLLDSGQLRQYGLNRTLSATKQWWECIDISKRELAFVSMEPWLTVSVLLCEDLARVVSHADSRPVLHADPRVREERFSDFELACSDRPSADWEKEAGAQIRWSAPLVAIAVSAAGVETGV